MVPFSTLSQELELFSLSADLSSIAVLSARVDGIYVLSADVAGLYVLSAGMAGLCVMVMATILAASESARFLAD